MSMSIFNNTTAPGIVERLGRNEKDKQMSLGRLMTGQRINSAKDDAAGLAIAANLAAQLTSSNQTVRNGSDALDIADTADAALGQTTDILGQLRELAVQSSSGGLNDVDRGNIQQQADGLRSELDRIAHATEYNGQALLNGQGQLGFQVGTNAGATAQINISTSDVTTGALGLGNIDVSSQNGAMGAIANIDDAMRAIAGTRATLGAESNRAASAITTALERSQSLASAQSRIRDADMAKEASDYSSSLIMGQAGVAVMAQSNQSHKQVLRLLGA